MRVSVPYVRTRETHGNMNTTFNCTTFNAKLTCRWSRDVCSPTGSPIFFR